jgi:GT2 family glycosyltransferase
VPHLDQPDRLALLLDSLHAQDFDMSRAEVIVVDNGSRVLPRDVVGRFPAVLLVEERAPGPGPARNRGVLHARAPLLAFTDADCVVARDWLSAILARFAGDPGLAIIGGAIRVFPRSAERPTMAEAYECVFGFLQRDYIARQGFSVTANLAVRRAVFEAVGPFAGISLAEDMDWGQRATRLGHATRYAPEVVVDHPARRHLAELYTKWDRNVNHHYAVFAQGTAGKVRWGLKTLAMGISPLGEIPRILRTDRLKGPGPRWRAFCGLAAVRAYRARRMLGVMLRPPRGAAGMQWNR